MAFVNEIPSAEDIEKFNLPYGPDLEKPIEQRRTWTADRARDVYLSEIGVTGNPAYEADYKMRAPFYLGEAKFEVILEPSRSSQDFKANPYHLHWPALLEIRAVRLDEHRIVPVLHIVSQHPNEPQSLLQNRSLNEFVALLKEALMIHKEGCDNQFIAGEIIVSFGF